MISISVSCNAGHYQNKNNLNYSKISGGNQKDN